MNVMRLVFIALVCLSSVLAWARPDRNAFLNRAVTSVPQLLHQVRNDAEVRDRFRRHFAMTDTELLTYFTSLRLARLTAPGAYKVYSVPPGGYVKMHVQKLRLGTPVFADPSGTPIMIVKCGNPLTLGPKGPEAFSDRIPLLATNRTEELRELEVEGQELSEFDELSAMTPDVLRPVDMPEEIIVTNESPIPIIGAPFPIAGWLLGLIGGGLIIGGGGGGGSEVVVPEPATLGVLAIASVALIVRRRRR